MTPPAAAAVPAAAGALDIEVGREIGGHDPETLAARAGTPFYAYDLDVIARRLAELRAVLPAAFEVAYATKANPSLAVVAFLGSLGVGGDIASGGELELVERAGIAASRVVFTGPGKSEMEHRAAISAGIRAITVESPGELARLEALAASMGRRVPILLRLAVGERSRHETVRIIGDAGAGKFGMGADDLRATAARASASPHLDLLGVHAFGASNLRDADALVEHVAATVAFAADVAAEVGVTLRLVDAGGGLGIPYEDESTPLDLARLGDGLAVLAAGWAGDSRLANLRVLLEPGRFLVGPAGVYVTRVIDVKRLDGRTVAIVDGGIHHVLRPALVRQPHRLVRVGVRGATDARPAAATAAGAAARGPGDGGTGVITAVAAVAGPLCTGLDILSPAAPVGDVQPGDLLAVLDVGAYGFTESMPLFLSRATPAELVLRGGRAAVVRPPLEPRHFLDQQVLPEWPV
jgi:diaminopimelate decarboxylase